MKYLNLPLHPFSFSTRLFGCIQEETPSRKAGINGYSASAETINPAKVKKIRPYASDRGRILWTMAENNNPYISHGYYITSKNYPRDDHIHYYII